MVAGGACVRSVSRALVARVARGAWRPPAGAEPSDPRHAIDPVHPVRRARGAAGVCLLQARVSAFRVKADKLRLAKAILRRGTH